MAGTATLKRDDKGRVQKGAVLNPAGRPPGPNKFNAEVRDMVQAALNRAGEGVQKKRRSLKDLEPGVAYLVEQAEENPTVFLGLVGKLMPAKVDVEMTMMKDLVDVLEARKHQMRQMRDVTPHQETEE